MEFQRDPRLVVLRGRDRRVEEIIERGYLKPGEVEDYPELMGVLPIIGAIAAALPAGITVVKDIWSSITGGNKDDSSSIIQQQILLQQQQSAQMQKILIYGGLGLGAILVLTMVMKNR